MTCQKSQVSLDDANESAWINLGDETMEGFELVFLAACTHHAVFGSWNGACNEISRRRFTL